MVVNWNRSALTLECLDSLAGSAVLVHAVVVDNGSHDDSVARIAAAYPEAQVVEMESNAGFAAGANAGVRAALSAGASWLLLLNNDATVERDMLSRLLAAAEDDVGLLAPTVVVHDRPDTVWPSAGRRRALTLAAFDTTARPASPEPYDVDWAAACALVVRREVWETVGLLDERYHMYYEDHDFCLRARAAGWRIVHVPAARARHRVAGSTGAGTPRQMYLMARSSVPYYLRHTSGWQRWLIVPYRLGSAVRTVGRALRQGRPAAAVAYLQGLCDGLRDARTTLVDGMGHVAGSL